MKILITGGHITPAIAVADQLHKILPGAEIVFVGRAMAIEGSSLPSEEGRIVKSRGFRFIPITAGRLTRAITIFSVIGAMRFPFGFLSALQICIMERPAVIVSFGGYVALPVVFAGWLLGIPSVTHEQTMVPGLANRIIGLFAKRICLTFAHSTRVFAATKTVVTGLPIRKALFAPPKRPPFQLDSKKPLIFFSGGSTGSQSLNRIIFAAAHRLTKYFTLIHQTGRLDFSRAPKIDGYVAVDYLDERDWSWVLWKARLFVGRSGANSVGEIASLGKVAIFVPLPWAAGGEQRENARLLVNAGSAIILEQKNMTPETLLACIEDTFAKIVKFEEYARAFSKTVPRDAARKVAVIIATLVNNA